MAVFCAFVCFAVKAEIPFRVRANLNNTRKEFAPSVWEGHFYDNFAKRHKLSKIMPIENQAVTKKMQKKCI